MENCLEYEVFKGCKGLKKRVMLLNDSARAVWMIRKMQYYSTCGKTVWLAKYYRSQLIRRYGIFVGYKTLIGKGLCLPHPNGIIMGEASIIGENCIIYQQVTIGSAHLGDYKCGKQPMVEDNVCIFAGAKIIGEIVVSSGCVIGANAVVTKNTEMNHIYVGVPAVKKC